MSNIAQSKAEVEYCKYLGAQIRKLREMQGLSQGDLAERVGITFQQLQKYESGKNRMTVFRLKQVMEVLELSMARFFENDFKNVPCVILDKTKINAHIDTIRNELKAIRHELTAQKQ